MLLGVEQSSIEQLATTFDAHTPNRLEDLCHVSGRKLPDGRWVQSYSCGCNIFLQPTLNCKGLEVAQQMGRETFLPSLFHSKMRIVEIQPVEPKPWGMPVGDVWLAWRVFLSRMACPVSSYQWPPHEVRFMDQHVWCERLVCGCLWHGTENLTGGHSGACHGLMLKAWPRSRRGLGCSQQAILSQLRRAYHERSVMLEPCLSSYQIHWAVHSMGNT